MHTFRIALTGDFLDESGQSAYGDIGLSAFAGIPYVQYHFLTDQGPVRDDTGYWNRDRKSVV